MSSLQLKEFFENHFNRIVKSSGGIYHASPSLLEWCEKHLDEIKNLHSEITLSALEIGCGPFSILENLNIKKYEYLFAIDYSEKMINFAKGNSKGKVRYFCQNFMDLESSPEFLNKQFDMIIDGHLYHCLSDHAERLKYLQIVKKMLKKNDGVFLLEFMVEDTALSFDDRFIFIEEKRTLLQQVGNQALPVRFIPKLNNCLDEFQQQGFSVLNFSNPPGWKIIFDPSRDMPRESDPGLIRVAFKIN